MAQRAGREIGRSYYGVGSGNVADRLYARFAGRRPGRTEVVSAEAAGLLRARIATLTEELREAGAELEDIPDLFYLLERMGSWAAAGHGVVELIRDTTSPLWSAWLLPHLLAGSARERGLGRFHKRVLEELAPALVDERFADGSGWPVSVHPVVRRATRARTLARKVPGELRRLAVQRSARRGPRSPAGQSAAPPPPGAPSPPGAPARVAPAADPFEQLLATVRDAVLSQPQHAAWAILDRARVEQVLVGPWAALDEMTRYYVWRLATVFLGMP